jgi:hypothetical protein
MFRNIGGEKFADVTTSARVGHLQKGHAISFADLDNDGDQDIYIELGGAYKGDAFHNSLYLNPGQDERNHWITLELVATDNRSIIGTSVQITFKENGKQRSVYFDVNSGGSFGASPLRKEIGLGEASLIEKISIRWHPDQQIQVFQNVKPNQFLRIRQGIDTLETVSLQKLDFQKKTTHTHH